MKRMKKLASLLLAMVMALALAAPALAAEGDVKITVPDALKDHHYAIYQIFTGTKVEGTDVSGDALKDIQWGDQASPAKIVEELQKIDTQLQTIKSLGVDEEGKAITYFGDLTAASGAQAVADALAKTKGNAAMEKLVAQALKGAMGSGTFATLPDRNGNAEALVPVGYYLIDDTSDPDGLNLLQITRNTPIRVKVSKVPELHKQVQDEKGNWVDATDYAVGTQIPFRLFATLPTNYAELDEYDLTFHDDMVESLKLVEGSISLKYYTPDQLNVDGTPKGDGTAMPTSDYTIKNGPLGHTATGEDDKWLEDLVCDFEVEIGAAKAEDSTIKGLAGGSVIVVEYKAELLKKIPEGSMNTSWLTTDDGFVSPPSITKVFTFDLSIDKVNGDGSEKLEGAEFTLEKWDPDVENEDGTKGAWGEEIKYSHGTKTETGEDGTETEVEDPANFQFKDLAAGRYRLTETKAPDNYTGLANPIIFNIDYDVIEGADGEPELSDLRVTIEEGSNQELTGNKDTGIISGQITNFQGIQLPDTGGIGTTIFYILGGILVVGAAVLLITKRRMNASEE